MKRIALALAIVFACSSGPVGTQAIAEDEFAQLANRAEPAIVAAYRADQKRVMDAACAFAPSMAPDCIALRRAAVLPVRARWRHVSDAWETARLAHSAYADALETCLLLLGDGGAVTQCPALPALETAAFDALDAYRCAVRAIGHPEADPITASPPACGSGAP